MSSKARFKFTVSEYGEGTPHIRAEPLGATLNVLQGLELIFDLKEGTALHEAQNIAGFLNENISFLDLVAVPHIHPESGSIN